MKKNNILYVITKLELGGAQKHLLDLLANLDRAKFNIFLFTAKEGLLLSDVLAIESLSVQASSFLERPINPLKDILALFEIYNFIKINNIDIVHTHSSKAGILGRFAAKLAKVKVIVHTVHGWPFNDFQPVFMRYFYIWLEWLSALLSDKLIVVSFFDRAKGLTHYIGSPDKYAVIRYGIDIDGFYASGYTIHNARKELGLGDNDLIVGTVSCFKPQKSPQDFVKLAYLIKGNMPQVKFVLIGDGVLRKRIESLIVQLKLQEQIILLGWRRDIPEILSAIDIFVLTSLWEGLPIAALEAMACSKPVVATDTGAIREIVQENKTGFLVKPKALKSMAEKLKLLLNDASLRMQFGLNAKNSLDSTFSLERMVGDTQYLYGSLIKCREEESAYAN